MTLELDFTNKTITVKGTIKVSELIAKVKELNLGDDWDFIVPIDMQRIDNPYPVYPQQPYWWETQPFYQGTDNLIYVSDTLTIIK